MSNLSPAGWVLVHRRAYGPDVTFGPFKTQREAIDWLRTRAGHGVRAVLVPLTDPNTDPRYLWDDLRLDEDSLEEQT